MRRGHRRAGDLRVVRKVVDGYLRIVGQAVLGDVRLCARGNDGARVALLGWAARPRREYRRVNRIAPEDAARREGSETPVLRRSARGDNPRPHSPAVLRVWIGAVVAVCE